MNEFTVFFLGDDVGVLGDRDGRLLTAVHGKIVRGQFLKGVNAIVTGKLDGGREAALALGSLFFRPSLRIPEPSCGYRA